MKPPVIPDTLRICEQCQNAIALMNGKRCLTCALKRFQPIAEAQQLVNCEFVPVSPIFPGDKLCPCGCGLPLEITQRWLPPGPNLEKTQPPAQEVAAIRSHLRTQWWAVMAFGLGLVIGLLFRGRLG